MGDNDGIVFVGMVAVLLTIFFCFIMIIIYIISCLQIKCDILVKDNNNSNSNKKKSILGKATLQSDGESDENIKKKEDRNIGLGSNFMLMLILSNFIGGIVELLLFMHYQQTDGDLDESICKVLGVAHNFFELCGICWTSLLTFLFYCSTKISHEIFYKEGKYLFIGFLYSIIISVIFSFGPLLNQYYGKKEYLCFFKYSEESDGDNKIFILLWNIGNSTVITLNCIFNCFWLCKTFGYYSKKTKILKKQSIKEYKQLLLYIWVFRIFPFVLIITGLIKVSTKIIGNFIESQIIISILGYSNVLIHNLNGFFNSLACFYFFRGVFWCCIEEEEDNNSNQASQCLKEVKTKEEEEEQDVGE